MTDYIEREKIGLTDFEIVMCNGDYKSALEMLLEKIASIPAADVVPVVRCGKCVFYEIADYGDGCTKNVCCLLNRQILNDDYCSYGMQKDGEMDG